MKVESVLRYVAWAVGSVAVATICYLVGQGVGHASSLDQAVLASVTKEKLSQDTQYRTTSDSLAANNARLAKLDDYDSKLGILKAQIDARQKELSSVGADLSEQKSELASLTDKVEKARVAPIDLPAGHFVVGRDIRAGRFTVVGSSNLIIDGEDGENKVNTILGEDGVDRYVCDLADGDQIDAHGPDRFYPMD